MMLDIIGSLDTTNTRAFARIGDLPNQKAANDDLPDQSYTRVTVLPSEVITAQDEESPYCYKIIAGSIRLVRVMPSGKRIVGQFLFPEDLFGFELGDEGYFSAEAISRTILIRYPREVIGNLAARDPSVARQLCELSKRRLRDAYSHMVMIGRQSSSERIATFLLAMSGHCQPGAGTTELAMPQRDIADYLCLTIETVCRELALFRRHGVIRYSGRRLVIFREKLALLTTAANAVGTSSDFGGNDTLWSRRH